MSTKGENLSLTPEEVEDEGFRVGRTESRTGAEGRACNDVHLTLGDGLNVNTGIDNLSLDQPC